MKLKREEALVEALIDCEEALKRATDVFYNHGAMDIGTACRDSANRGRILLDKLPALPDDDWLDPEETPDVSGWYIACTDEEPYSFPACYYEETDTWEDVHGAYFFPSKWRKNPAP